MFKVISFDLDNTLYDNLPVIQEAERRSADFLATAFAREKQPFDFEAFLAIRHRLMASDDIAYENLNLMRQSALTEFCQPLANADEVCDQAFRLFIEARSLASIPEAVERLVQELAASFKLVSVTNGNCDAARLTIGHHFSSNYSPLGGLRAKPHPQMLQKVLEDFAIGPPELLHVGDSLAKDGEAANAAGAEFYQLAPFVNPRQMEQAILEFRHFLNQQTG